MKNDPILGTTTGPFLGHEKCRMNVTGGLHYMRGNNAPYFSLTADVFCSDHDIGGGCMHEEILRKFPQFADIAALHLSDIDGVPMYAEANGWYNLAGALGGMDEQYHVGNSERHFPCTPPDGKPWQNTEYRKPTPEECLQIFADFCRVSTEEAGKIAERVMWDTRREFAPGISTPRKRWAAICESMRPRWKAEADACITKHGLRVFGDPWEAKRAA